MRIAIRVDASADIGTGHVRRSLSLAKALRGQGAEVRFTVRALGIDSATQIEREGFTDTTVLYPPDGAFVPDSQVPHSAWAQVSAARDVADTSAALASFAPDWVIVDSYAFDAMWHRGVADALGCRIAVIDDLADRSLAAECVIDHNFHPDHASKFGSRLGKGTTLLAGPSYAMIDPSYAEAPRHRLNDKVHSVGVFMGGIDARKDSLVVLAALNEAGWHGPVEVVSTSHNPAISELEVAVGKYSNAKLSCDLPDLAAFFARHDLQVGAGGGSIWERCCIGPPTIALVCAENQRHSIPWAHQAGFLFGIDHSHDLLARRRALVEALHGLITSPAHRRMLSQEARALVDGRGTARIAAHIMERE